MMRKGKNARMCSKSGKSGRTHRNAPRKGSGAVQLAVSVGLILVGCFLLCFGFFTPPEGEIDTSVLVAFGEILTFAGALFGIDYRYRSLIR